MKVQRSAAPGHSRQVADACGEDAPTPGGVAPVIVPDPEIAASHYGIPEEEFTPSVRGAIVALSQRVERLRHDVEVERSQLQVMVQSADQDVLLPVLNRRAFMRELGRFVAIAERYGTVSSLIYFDLDDFKSINDAYGHAAGDVVLAHFTTLVAAQIRETDLLARLGGDEFGVILSHVASDQAVRKAASLVRKIRTQPANWREQTIELSVSYGISELRAGEGADAAMARADRAMYAQKRAGR